MKIAVEIGTLAIVFWLEGVFPPFRARRNRFRHALRNLGIGSLNGLVISLGFAAVTLKSIQIAENHEGGSCVKSSAAL